MKIVNWWAELTKLPTITYTVGDRQIPINWPLVTLISLIAHLLELLTLIL